MRKIAEAHFTWLGTDDRWHVADHQVRTDLRAVLQELLDSGTAEITAEFDARSGRPHNARIHVPSLPEREVGGSYVVRWAGPAPDVRLPEGSMRPRYLLEAEARRQLASFTAADLHNDPDPFSEEPPVHIDHGGLEDGRNVLRSLCGARPNGRDQFVWFDPEDPWFYENDFLAGERVRKAPAPVPAAVTCPRCLRIAEKVMKHHVALEYAQREER